MLFENFVREHLKMKSFVSTQMVENSIFFLLVWNITKQQLNNEALLLGENVQRKEFHSKNDLHSLNA